MAGQGNGSADLGGFPKARSAGGPYKRIMAGRHGVKLLSQLRSHELENDFSVSVEMRAQEF